MRCAQTFTDDEFEPCEHDGDLKILIRYCVLCQNRETFCHFAKELM